MAVPAGMMTMAGDHEAMEMSEDMSCCPHTAPVPDCAKDCPLMALCLAGTVLNVPSGAGLLVPVRLASLVLPGNDMDLASLGRAQSHPRDTVSASR
jgi:hypothetical protein